LPQIPYVSAPELFDVPINSFFGEPDINTGVNTFWRASAVLEHRFSQYSGQF
jgi:hypothetical protein